MENLENLKLLPTLLKKLQLLEDKLNKIENSFSNNLDLTKRKNVRIFLNISESTLINIMKDGRFKPGVHYIKTIKGKRTKIEFIESAVIQYKKDNSK